MTTPRRFVNIAVQICLVLAMVLPLLAQDVQATPYINTQQSVRLQKEAPQGYGPGGPFGTWQKLKETQTFYLHGNCDMSDTVLLEPSQPDCPTQLQDQDDCNYVPAFDPVTGSQPMPCAGDPGSGKAPPPTGNAPPPPATPMNLWYDNQLPPSDGTWEEVHIGESAQIGFAPEADFPGGSGFDNPSLKPAPPTDIVPVPLSCLPQIPTMLDDTGIFAFKVDMYAFADSERENHLYVQFWDLQPGCTQVPIIGIIAQPDNLGGAFGAVSLVGNSNVIHYSSQFQTVSPLYGYNLKAGHGIGISIHAESNDFCGGTPNDCGDMKLVFDTTGAPSKFQVIADSTRVNQWTEDRFGSVTPTFPTANVGNVPTNSLDRNVYWKGVQANTWGHKCRDGTPLQIVYADRCAVQTQYLKYSLTDGIEEHSTVWRVRDMTPTHQGTGYCQRAGEFCYGELITVDETLGLQGGDPGQDELKLKCCDDFNKPIQTSAGNGNADCPTFTMDFPTAIWTPARPKGSKPRWPDFAPPVQWWLFTNPTGLATDGCLGLQKYSYTFPYKPTFKDGVYRVEFQDELHGWNAGEGSSLLFYVGGNGFDFKFHQDEPRVDDTRTIADHLVALKEPTKYSMLLTNKGVGTDSYQFAIPTPGEGWSATVSPHSVTLSPKASANIDVIVTPPSNVQAGKIKVVSVTATSPGSNAVQTLFTRTTYTAEIRHGVFVTSPSDLVEIRPGLTKVLGAVVHNNGTVRDNYILTTSGAPAGWAVNMSPTFLDVMAASREDISITVKADPAAPPALSFQLTVKACLVSDNKVCGSKDIPFRVYLIHDVQLSTLPPLGACDKTTPAALAGQSAAPLCSKIEARDAEYDYRVQGGTAACNGISAPGDPCWIVANKDTHFDNSTTFRILVDNKGDSTDQIDLSTAWDPPLYHPKVNAASYFVRDGEDCDGTTDPGFGISKDGVPDGWRFRILGGSNNPWVQWPHLASRIADPGMTVPQRTNTGITFDSADQVRYNWFNHVRPQYGTGRAEGFSGEQHIGTVTLGPHTQQYVYFELFNVAVTNGQDPRPDGFQGCVSEPTYCKAPTAAVLCSSRRSENWRKRMPSENAFLRVSYRSMTEQSIRGNFLLHATLQTSAGSVHTQSARVDPSGNDVANSVHQVLLETGLGQNQSMNVPIGTATPYATFNMVATNIGNEYDNLKIDVNTATNGWTHTIVAGPVPSLGTGIIPTGDLLMVPTAMPVCSVPPADGSCTPRSPRGVSPLTPPLFSACPYQDAPKNMHILCPEMGVYDAVNFQVRCAPPSYARSGDTDDITVTVTSDRANALNPTISVFKTITLKCRVQGNYEYEVDNPNHDLLAYKTQTIAFPFSIHNTGLANDRYSISLDAHVLPDGTTVDPKTDAWNPQTSSGAIAAVPAGFWYHGFLSVTVPESAPITDPAVTEETACTCDHFRVKIQSIDAVSVARADVSVLESKFLDFTAIVTDTPSFTVSAEPVTIAGGSSDAVKIKALDCPPGQSGEDCDVTGFTAVRFDGYYIDPARNLPGLPRGYNFTCLSGDNDGDGWMDYTELLNNPVQNPLSAAQHPGPNIEKGIPHPHYSNQRFCFSRAAFPAIPTTPVNFNPPTCSVSIPTVCGSREYEVTPTFSPGHDAIQQLEVSVPPDQLGISRVAHRIQATATKNNRDQVTYTDAILNMKTVYGVELREAENKTTRIVPPGADPNSVSPTAIVFNVSVRNSGLTPQSVLLSNSPLPPGWSISYDTQSVQVQPPGFQLPGFQTDPDGTQTTATGTCSGVALDDAGNPQKCAVVNPQDAQIVHVGIVAPPNAEAGKKATVIIFGTVQEDTSKVAQLVLTAEVGQYGMSVNMTPESFWVQPDEAARFVVSVTNTGTVRDNINLRATLPAAFSDSVFNCGPNTSSKFQACWTSVGPFQECNPDPLIQTVALADTGTCYIDALEPKESRQVVLEVKTPALVAPTRNGPGYTIDVVARSGGSTLAAITSSISRTIKVLNYVAADVDGDGGQGTGPQAGLEYAIDACTKSQLEGCAPDAADGYETFREAACTCGIVSREAPLAQFLDEDAKDGLEVAGKLKGESYFLDANNDGHADHFLDTDGDSQPDVLWVPDAGGDVTQMVVVRMNFTRDVTGDQLPELFIDLDLDGRWDAVFDLAKGKFIPLLQVFIDEDSIADYVVDANGNGQVDPSETVLLGGPGGTLGGTIFNVDMNGDGTLDKAFDLVGADGVPEYFIDGNCNPAQKACASLKIKARDVTGDGRADWTYDHTGKNGREDAYYDPHCDASKDKCSGMIDTQAQFLRDLQRYWWIGAFFVVALVLFVALLVVTRRR